MKTLREIENGKTFEVADIEFVKVKETDKGTIVVTKDCLFNSKKTPGRNLTQD